MRTFEKQAGKRDISFAAKERKEYKGAWGAKGL
jgi:hypothetical protein